MGEKKPLPHTPFQEQPPSDKKLTPKTDKKHRLSKHDNVDDDDDEFEFFHEFKRDKVRSLIHLITNELKAKGSDTEYLFLPFRPEQTNERLLSFLNSIFPLGNGVPVADEKIQRILNKTEVWTLFQALKYIWCRLPRGEIIGWTAYNDFKLKEAEQNFSQKSFLEIMPKCLDSPDHASIVYDFFDLIVTMASNSKKNKMSARKIAKMSAIWAFHTHPDTNTTNMDFDSRQTDINGYKQGLSEWIPAAEAMFHLLLAFIRSFVPTDSDKVRLPKSLKSILFDNAYPPKNSETFTSETILTVPIASLSTNKFSRKPWQLIERCNELMNFDEPENFETREDFALFKSLFKKKKNIDGISSKMSKESKRLMKCMTTKHSTFQAGWSKRKNLTSKNISSSEDSISISRVDIDDYFIWAWLSTLSYEQTSQKRKMFGRSLILEFEFDGFKKWLILEESDAVLENKAYDSIDRTDYINTDVRASPKDEFIQKVSTENVERTTPIVKEQSEAIQSYTPPSTISPVLYTNKTSPLTSEISSKALPVPSTVQTEETVQNKQKSEPFRSPSPARNEPPTLPPSNPEYRVHPGFNPSNNEISSVQPTRNNPLTINENRFATETHSSQEGNFPPSQRNTSPQLGYQIQQEERKQQMQQEVLQAQRQQTGQKPVPLFTSPYSKATSKNMGSQSNYGQYEPQYRKFSPSPTPLARSKGQSVSNDIRQSSSTYDERSIRDLPEDVYGKESRSTPEAGMDDNPVAGKQSANSDVQGQKGHASSAVPDFKEGEPENEISDLTNLVDDMTLAMINGDPGDAVKDMDASVRTRDEKFETLTMFDKYKAQAQKSSKPDEFLNDSLISVVTPLDIPSRSQVEVGTNDDTMEAKPVENNSNEKELPVTPLVSPNNKIQTRSLEAIRMDSPVGSIQPKVSQPAASAIEKCQKMTKSPAHSLSPVRQPENFYQTTYSDADYQASVNQGYDVETKPYQYQKYGSAPVRPEVQHPTHSPVRHDNSSRTLAPQVDSRSISPVVARSSVSPNGDQTAESSSDYRQNLVSHSNVIEAAQDYPQKQYPRPTVSSLPHQQEVQQRYQQPHQQEVYRSYENIASPLVQHHPKSQPNQQYQYQDGNYNGPAHSPAPPHSMVNRPADLSVPGNDAYGHSQGPQREQYRRGNEPRQNLGQGAPQNSQYFEAEGQYGQPTVANPHLTSPSYPGRNVYINANPHMNARIDNAPTPIGTSDREMRERTPRQPAPSHNMYPRQQGPPSAQVLPDHGARRMHPGQPVHQHPHGPQYGSHQRQVPVHGPPVGATQGSLNPQYNGSYAPQRYGPPSGPPAPQMYSSPQPPMQQQQFRSPVNGGRVNQYTSPVPLQQGFLPPAQIPNKLHSGNMDKQTSRKKLHADIRSGNFGI
ncbi:unnamed protein product [Kluyveromyces dobzhanskii CBS 2104]|uniref:WGS project CCBQ000000000 data, contig 00272 n=1 Tax=Kluyveromyces dobzhanskii CBS 2104 TaxID=1427455 RepID=A0A0A8L8X5_9SACH|nr:unnamed protein product [Kluyveromyces dobzhanskii CBS 2104]